MFHYDILRITGVFIPAQRVWMKHIPVFFTAQRDIHKQWQYFQISKKLTNPDISL